MKKLFIYLLFPFICVSCQEKDILQMNLEELVKMTETIYEDKIEKEVNWRQNKETTDIYIEKRVIIDYLFYPENTRIYSLFDSIYADTITKRLNKISISEDYSLYKNKYTSTKNNLYQDYLKALTEKQSSNDWVKYDRFHKMRKSTEGKNYYLKGGSATLQLSESIYSSGFPRAHIRSDGTGFFYYSNNKTQNCKINLTWTKRGNNAEINIGTNPNCPGVASKFNGSYPIE